MLVWVNEKAIFGSDFSMLVWVNEKAIFGSDFSRVVIDELL